jgi:hypothetical protein
MALASDLAVALDPVLLAEQAGITPDPWQADVLRSRASRLLLNCARQSGKSLTTAGLAVHTAVYVPGSLTLLLSPAERQSKELFRKAVGLYRALGRPVPADSETTLWLDLANGSRIVALPGTEGTIRGFSDVTLLVVDEASRVLDELYYTVRPMLAVSGGRLVALSTPFGRRGWWYEAWEDGGDAWERVRITADQCPRISPEFLAEERASLPATWYSQEYECAFADTVSQVFTYEDVAAAVTSTLTPLFAGGE